MHASGFGQVGDGRSFSFHVERQSLVVEVYRPRLNGPVPQDEDVVAVATRKLTDIDLADERSLAAAVRDAVAAAQPVPRAKPLTALHGTVVVVTDVPAMSWVQVIVLSILQGLTEFLPVSSSGHLAIASRVFFNDDAGASFTAVTQLGTEVAVLMYFARDIGRILKAWFDGLFVAARRSVRLLAGLVGHHRHDPDRCVRPGVQGRNPNGRTQSVVDRDRADRVLRRHRRRGVLRPQTRHVEQLTWKDSITVGLAQCLALVPGVSRSGATISAGLFLGLDRELAARFGFLLAIPAVFASGLFSLPDAFHPVGEGMSASGPQLLVATLIAFVVGFAAVAWFLRFLVRHSMYWFVGYRVLLGVVVLILLGTGVVAAV